MEVLILDDVNSQKHAMTSTDPRNLTRVIEEIKKKIDTQMHIPKSWHQAVCVLSDGVAPTTTAALLNLRVFITYSTRGGINSLIGSLCK